MTLFDNLALLRAFVAIVECGSISAGARSLRISQPTLSRQLQSLEEQCGVALLHRDTHQMQVTVTGLRFLADARAMLAYAEEAEARLHEEQSSLNGHLRIFGTIDLGQTVVTRMISQFLLKHPKTTAELALTNRPLHMIQEGCDVGILPGKITDESVVARRVGSVTLHVVAAPSLLKGRKVPKRPLDLKTWPWISLSRPQFWSARDINLIDPSGKNETLKINPIFVSEGVTSIREAAREGVGLAIMPDFLAENDFKSGRLVRVLPKWQARDVPVSVVYAGQRVLSARVSAFLDFATQYLRHEPLAFKE